MMYFCNQFVKACYLEAMILFINRGSTGS